MKIFNSLGLKNEREEPQRAEEYLNKRLNEKAKKPKGHKENNLNEGYDPLEEFGKSPKDEMGENILENAKEKSLSDERVINKNHILDELRYLKRILGREQKQLRRHYDSQWKVLQAHENLWNKVRTEKSPILVSPRSLAELGKDVIAKTVLEKLIESLNYQLQQCEERLVKLEVYESRINIMLPDMAPMLGKEIRFFRRFVRNRRKYLETQKLFQQSYLDYTLRKRLPLSENREVLLSKPETLAANETVSKLLKPTTNSEASSLLVDLKKSEIGFRSF